MMCYRDQSYCTDADKCATPCSRRLNEQEYDEACKRADFSFPVAYMSMKATCDRYEAKS